MVLKALEIQGFKSFPDKTKISFEKGITAVVGPNGSGKSNISDAMRWVLGETSSRQLRGGGKMEDVIFGGTKTRGPMGFAAVSIYIDNTDRRLEVDQDEVVITRRYYRSTESEYAVNGQNVRLKDVYELLLDTGLGRDGYSIIGQGKIAEIVAAKSAERREIFEEASGISRYRYRKNEAERKLESTEENLLRLRDILNELEERVGPLAKESEKAAKFIELSAQRKGLEITLWLDSIEKAKESLRAHQRSIEVAAADYAKAEEAMLAADAAEEAAFFESRRLEGASEEYLTAAAKATEEYAAITAGIAVMKSNIANAEEALRSFAAELEKTGQTREVLEREQKEQAEAMAGAKEKLQKVESALAGLSGELVQLNTTDIAFDEKRSALQRELDKLLNTQTELRVENAALQANTAAGGARLESAQKDLTAAIEEKKALEAEQAETLDFMQAVQKSKTALENIKEGTALKLESRQKRLQEAAAQSAAAEQKLAAANQRATLLEELERSMDGFSSSVKAVMKAGEQGRLRGLLGPVSNLLRVNAGYEIAVETALGFALQNVVVENEAAAKEAIAFLKQNNAGRATFLPLDTVQPRDLDRGQSLPAGATVASGVVACNPKYDKIVSNLLGRILVVEDINTASAVARATGYKYRVVTKDGQLVGAGGSFTGGSVARSAGLFSRKLELEELAAGIEKLKKSRAEAQETERTVKIEVEKLAAEASATEWELAQNREDEIRCEAQINHINSALAAAGAGAGALQAEIDTLKANMAAAAMRSSEITNLLSIAGASAAAMEQNLVQTGVEGAGFAQQRAELSQRQQALALEKLAAEKDIESAAMAAEALRQRGGGEEARAGEIAENMQRTQGAITEIKGKIEEAKNQMAALKEAEQTAKDKSQEARTARLALDEQTAKARTENRALIDERERLSKEIARLEERQRALEAEYDITTARLWEEYELTPLAAAAFKVEFTGITELRRQVGEIRSKIKALGNVNVGAIDEYKEVSARHIFLKEQVGDVERSKTELLKLIQNLEGEMAAIFKESFAQINSHFTRIFTELFGGGTARLYLSNEDDILESGIEIEVAPPGKIIKSLTALSGGEQALVAITIYFAILAVNPAPFCVLDEIEAALDDVNVTRYAGYLRRICEETQFVLITHRRGTMEEADVLYGITMQENGVSKVLRLNTHEAAAELIG